MTRLAAIGVFALISWFGTPETACAADLEGRWSTGRKAVFILHQDNGKLTGWIDSGPGERSYTIVDGTVQGDDVSFFVLHDDKDDPEVIENGGKPFRNTAKGTIRGDELTISGAREGSGQRPYKLVLTRIRSN
jgi:hypothetical protein